jgi:hypothetical protein
VAAAGRRSDGACTPSVGRAGHRGLDGLLVLQRRCVQQHVPPRHRFDADRLYRGRRHPSLEANASWRLMARKPKRRRGSTDTDDLAESHRQRLHFAFDGSGLWPLSVSTSAFRIISRARNNQIAFSAKRTSDGRQHRLARSRLTRRGPEALCWLVRCRRLRPNKWPNTRLGKCCMPSGKLIQECLVCSHTERIGGGKSGSANAPTAMP